MPYLFNLFRGVLCGTVSNAFEKSIIIISTCNLLLSDWARSYVVIISCDFVECLLRKSCCLSRVAIKVVHDVSDDDACSSILQHIDVSDMGW